MYNSYFDGKYLNVSLLPANEVCEGYVFTPVCQSFCSQGGSTWAGTPPWVGTPPRQVPQGRYTPLPGTPPGRYPRAGTPPSLAGAPPWAGTPRAGIPPWQVHPLAGTPPWAGTPPLWQVHPPGQVQPPGSSACWEMRATSGRYTSYWNAFLLWMWFHHQTLLCSFVRQHWPKRRWTFLLNSPS